MYIEVVLVLEVMFYILMFAFRSIFSVGFISVCSWFFIFVRYSSFIFRFRFFIIAVILSVLSWIFSLV